MNESFGTILSEHLNEWAVVIVAIAAAVGPVDHPAKIAATRSRNQ